MLAVNAWFHELDRPLPYQAGAELWTDAHIAGEMLKAHLSPDTDAASYKPDTIQAICAFLPRAMQLKAGDAVVDLGCGPGLYSREFAAQGYVVTGIDQSENSLAYARGLCAGWNATFDQTNYLRPFGSERFDAAFLIYQDYGVLSPMQRRTLLRNIHAALKPGGHFALDVPSLAEFALRQDKAAPAWEAAERGFWRPHPYVALHRTYIYPEDHVSCDMFAVLDEEVAVYRNWQAYFSPESIAQELRAGGFAVKSIWSDLTGAALQDDSPVMGVLCQKA